MLLTLTIGARCLVARLLKDPALLYFLVFGLGQRLVAFCEGVGMAEDWETLELLMFEAEWSGLEVLRRVETFGPPRLLNVVSFGAGRC